MKHLQTITVSKASTNIGGGLSFGYIAWIFSMVFAVKRVA